MEAIDALAFTVNNFFTTVQASEEKICQFCQNFRGVNKGQDFSLMLFYLIYLLMINLKFCFHLNFSQVPLVTHCFIFPGNKICVFKRLVNMVGQHWLSNIILFKHMNTAPRTRPEHILTNIWFLLIKFGVAESSSFYLNESD